MLEYFRKQALKKICLLLRPVMFCNLVANKGERETRGTADETQGTTGKRFLCAKIYLGREKSLGTRQPKIISSI